MLIEIDAWEFLKGVLTWTFWTAWLIIKMIWPFLLLMILVAISPRLFKTWRKRRKEQVGFKP